MKNLNMYFTAPLVLLTTILSAQVREMDKAIEKGKTDLIEILNKTGNDFDFGLNSKEVMEATAASEIPYSQVKFESLLKYNGGNVETILTNTQKFIVPLVVGNQVITTLSITERKKGSYEVSELVNQEFSNDLNVLPETARQNRFKEVTIVYVPNLNTVVYNFEGKSYTTYDGSSLKQGQKTEELLKRLKIDAIAFQDEYGEILKTQKLVE